MPADWFTDHFLISFRAGQGSTPHRWASDSSTVVIYTNHETIFYVDRCRTPLPLWLQLWKMATSTGPSSSNQLTICNWSFTLSSCTSAFSVHLEPNVNWKSNAVHLCHAMAWLVSLSFMAVSFHRWCMYNIEAGFPCFIYGRIKTLMVNEFWNELVFSDE